MRDNISAVMIVKDEERFLPQCLESLKDIMPVVIVDTGSTDKTMEIAHEYGAELHEHPWNDSFSEARNHALGYVKTEWALQIDADEDLLAITESALDSLSLDNDAYQTPIHNQMPNRSTTLHHGDRIYQPQKVHYKWRVHNELVVKGKVGIASLSIRHYGYGVSDEELQKKYENTLRLLMMDLHDAGYVPRNVRYLVQTYRSLQRHADVLRILDHHADKLSPFPGQFQEAIAGTIVAHNALDDNAKAKVVGIQLLDKYPEALDALFYMCIVYMQDQSWELAMEYCARFIKIRSELQLEGCDPKIIYHTWNNRAEAFQNIGICASILGNKAQAALFFMRAEMLAEHRTDIAGFAANTDNAMCLLLDGDKTEAQPGIVKLTNPDEATVQVLTLSDRKPQIENTIRGD